MKRARLLLTLITAVAVSACGAQGVTKSSPKTPVQMEKQSDASEAEERVKEDERVPHHVAPPPAYGNKVVQRAPMRTPLQG